MQVLASNIDTNSKDFQLNAEFNRGLASELKKKIEKGEVEITEELIKNLEEGKGVN
jgi:hypothetical protein